MRYCAECRKKILERNPYAIYPNKAYLCKECHNAHRLIGGKWKEYLNKAYKKQKHK